MTFNSHYWPSLDNPGEWNLYHVYKVVRGAVHADGQIDVLERKFLGPQYITLLKHPDFPLVGQEYSTDPLNNVPPTKLDGAALYEGMCADGIGEIRNNMNPPLMHVPPILLLPNDTTPGRVVHGVSKIWGGPEGPGDFKWDCGVTHKNWVWPDSVRTFLHEYNNNHYYNYVFAAGEFGKPRGLVSWWEGHGKPGSAFAGGLEYWAVGCGKI